MPHRIASWIDRFKLDYIIGALASIPLVPWGFVVLSMVCGSITESGAFAIAGGLIGFIITPIIGGLLGHTCFILLSKVFHFQKPKASPQL